MRVQSLARRFLISVGVMTVAVTLLASVVTYVAFKAELEQREIASLRQYVAERALREERQFADLGSVHRAATEALLRRLEGIDEAAVGPLLDKYMPLRADGTRRTVPELFEGRLFGGGDAAYGLGGFLADAERLTPFEKRLFVSALTVTSRFGEAQKGAYDNFYFYTPQTRMVMFAPDRPDKLMFYREEAPASFRMGHEQMAQIILPANNPTGAMACTDLQRKITDDAGARSAVACVTPVWLDGRMIGAFGSSLELSGYFRRAVDQGLPGAANMIISRDGRLVAFPESEGPAANAAGVAEWEARFDTDGLAALIRKDGKRSGVVKSPDGSRIVAYGLLRGPNWYFLVSRPTSAVTAAAALSSLWVLTIGIVASVLIVVAVMLLARRTVVSPLGRLLASAQAEGAARGSGRDIADIENRRDEIGLLAQALRSERERADEIMDSLEDRVRCRTTELEAALQEKSRFLANMSHELRTPLNGVVAVSEVLGQRQKSRKDRELAEVIIASGRLLEQVLTDILDVSKIEAGQMRLQESDFELETLVQQIASLHRAAAEAKGLKLGWTIDERARGAWRADPVRLTQILSNLLSNAVKFTESGRIDLRVEATGEGLCFSVRDTGIGFDAETAARLFQRFEQADASITRRFGGTGLGLSICRSLAALMGGTVEAQSSPGEGSVFRLIVPLARAEARAPEEASAAQAAAPLDGAVRVLLAEDHPTNQKVVKLILEMAGVIPTVVSNGRQALEALASDRFDAVLMDMQMPEMDGLTATVELRRREAAQGLVRTPVIMLTANALDEHAAASREAGADLHVTKPVRPDILLAAISEVIGQGADAGTAPRRLAG